MAYQDAYINGVVTKFGERNCSARFELIATVLRPYRRPFTVWDLGSNLGYFGLRIADEFDATSVMVDQRPVLVESCRANKHPATIAMTHRLSADDLIELAQSEHADVVLALNVLHHMPDWPTALAAILALGEHVIIETPGAGDVQSANYLESQALLNALWAHEPSILGWSPSHVTPGVMRPMLLFKRPKTAVTASYAYRARVRPRGPHAVRPHDITSTPTKKVIHYASGEVRGWHPGMNLWNWLQMGGSYPDRATVQQAVRSVDLSQPHGDFKPWNLILQGQTVQAIDGGHRKSVDDAQGLAYTLAWIDRPELAYAH
jgi:hypothetical protein